jgi:hypothetical protein
MFYFSQQKLLKHVFLLSAKLGKHVNFLVQVGEKNGVAAEWPKWQVRQAYIWAEIFRIL